MNPRGTFERVYDAIRRQLEMGRFAPGDHLEPAQQADDLNSSITPVRDALQRLVGERLVEASPGDGFRLPLLTEVGLRQLYDWNNKLLQLSLKAPLLRASGLGPAVTGETAADASALVERTGRLFSCMAALTGNIEHSAAISSLNSRLSMVRIREFAIVSDQEAELERMEQAFSGADNAGLRRLVATYHRRRQRLADQLVVALQLR